MDFPELSAYELLKTEQLPDFGAAGYLLRHKKSGAHIAIVDSEDENRTFFAGFRTPMDTSNGVPHIIEHTVLNGSDKFPDKNAFDRFGTGSLAGFVSAGTAQDKTMYFYDTPNEKDFRNLLTIYMDVMFFPLVRYDDRSFRQEGWHYELKQDASGEEKLTVNGVVFNEMKGVLSSADYQAERAVRETVYAHSLGRREIGGDPLEIPNLTYSEFQNYYNKYYRASNSYWLLSGKLDYKAVLEQIDRECLSLLGSEEIDAGYAREPDRTEPEIFSGCFTSTGDKAYYAYAAMSRHSLDADYHFGITVLQEALCTGKNAPLRRALVENGFAEDVYMLLDSSSQDPLAAIMVKGAEKNRLEEFRSIVERTLCGIAENGFDRDLLTASIRRREFSFLKEENSYGVPKGIQNGVEVFDSWLFDADQPFLYLHPCETYERLLRKAENGWFEQLVRELFLKNNNCSIGCITPDAGKQERLDRALADMLAARKEAMSPDELEAVRRGEQELREWMESGDTDVEIPCVQLSDLERDRVLPGLFAEKAGNAVLYYQEKPMRRICRLTMLQPMAKEGTDHAELLGAFGRIRAMRLQTDLPQVREAACLPWQGFLRTDLMLFPEDASEVLEKLPAVLAGPNRIDSNQAGITARAYIAELREQFVKKGQYCAMREVRGSFSFADKLESRAFGAPAVLQLETLPQDSLADAFNALAEAFAAVPVQAALWCGPEALLPPAAACVSKLSGNSAPCGSESAKAPAACSVGYIMTSKVNFNAIGGIAFGSTPEQLAENYLACTVLRKYYLDKKIRREGGAYHTIASAQYDGSIVFSSFRDSRVDGTYTDFLGAADYLKTASFTAEEWEQIVIGCLAEHDKAQPPFAAADRMLSNRLSGWTSEQELRFRHAVLDSVPEQTAGMGTFLEQLLSTCSVATYGSRECIEPSSFLKEKKELC